MIGETSAIAERWDQIVLDVAPATAAHWAHLFKQFANWAVDLRLVDEGLLDFLPHWVSQKTIEADATLDFEAVWEAALPRERLIIALMLGCGLRAKEVSAVRWRDVDFTRRTLLLHGKLGHERLVDLSPFAWDELAGGATHLSRLDGYVVMAEKGWQRPLSPSAVANAVRAAFRRTGQRISPHSLRREAARRWAAEGWPIEKIQHMLGHASMDTSGLYLRALVGDPHSVVDGRTYSIDDKDDRDPVYSAWLARTHSRGSRFREPAHTFACVEPQASLAALVEEYLAWHHDRWGVETRRRVGHALRRFAREVEALEYDAVHAWLQSKTEWKPGTRRFQVQLLARFTSDLFARGKIRSDPLAATNAAPKERHLARILTEAQCRSLLAQTKDTTTRMLCVLILQQALRPRELANLRVEDFDFPKRTMTVGDCLVPLTTESAKAVRAHLRRTRVGSGPLIPGRFEPLRYESVARRVSKACNAANIPGNATILRATALAGIVESAAPIHAVAQVVGHTDITSTMRYVRPSGGERRQANVWTMESTGEGSEFLDLHESARILGIVRPHLKELMAKAGVSGELVSGTRVLSGADRRRIYEYRAAHPVGKPYLAPTHVLDAIDRYVADERSFAWISRRFERDEMETGNFDGWSADRVKRLYRQRHRLS